MGSSAGSRRKWTKQVDGVLISDVQLIGKSKGLHSGSSTITWTFEFGRDTTGKRSNTFCVGVSSSANSSKFSPCNLLMRFARVLYGSTGSGLMSLQDRVGNHDRARNINQPELLRLCIELTFQRSMLCGATVSLDCCIMTSFKW